MAIAYISAGAGLLGAALGSSGALLIARGQRSAELRRWLRDEAKGAYRAFRRTADVFWRSINENRSWEDYETRNPDLAADRGFEEKVQALRRQLKVELENVKREFEEARSELLLVGSRSVCDLADRINEFLLDSHDPHRPQMRAIEKYLANADSSNPSDLNTDALAEPDEKSKEAEFASLKQQFTDAVRDDLGLPRTS
jgi:gas vesicle protein